MRARWRFIDHDGHDHRAAEYVDERAILRGMKIAEEGAPS
jgi:hypothetical protein